MTGSDSQVGTQLTMNRLFRHVAVLAISSVVAGVLSGGIGGRIVMRISAVAAGPEMVGRLTENGNRIGDFTVGGTAALIVFGGIFTGIIAIVVVVAADPWLRWLGPLQGLGFGFVALAIGGAVGAFETIDFLILDPPGLNVGMFVGLHFLFGFTVSGTAWLLDRKLPAATEEDQPGYIIAAAAPGALSLFLILPLFTVPSFCGCDPAYAIGAMVIVMLASAGIFHASSIRSDVPHWLSRTATVTGFGSLGLLLVLGLSATLDQIQRIF